jgi:hypothetical protein
MNKLTALGMELDYDADSINITPLNCIVVADGFDSNGATRHVLMTTPGMTNVQASGLVRLAEEWTKLNIMNDLIRGAYSEEE